MPSSRLRRGWRAFPGPRFSKYRSIAPPCAACFASPRTKMSTHYSLGYFTNGVKLLRQVSGTQKRGRVGLRTLELTISTKTL